MSLAVQESRICSWCEATEAALVEIVADAGVSGTKPLEERPAGHRIASLLASRKPDADAVCIARLDRLGRDAAETLKLLRQFSTGAVGLVSVADRIDLTTPSGKALAQMTCVFGEMERELLSQRTSDALCEMRSRGQVYGPVPFGFLRDGDRLIEHADEQRVLKRIRRLRAKGKSYRAVAIALNRSGTASKRGGIWHPPSIRSVLLTAEKVGRPAEATS
jgi:DNA invertase Pin-like site-specific DNA recombinase